MNNNKIKKSVKAALKEDIRKGDVTSNLTINKKKLGEFELLAKEDFIICGIDFFIMSFYLIDKKTKINFLVQEGDKVKKGDIIAQGKGLVRKILLAERVALNFLQHLSGIATKTNFFVEEVKDYKAKILDTRKTIPLYREAAKYAVKIGGGENHRFFLDDQILIKDNHIAGSGGVVEALSACRHSKLKIEIECESLEQVQEVLTVGADIIMLDNMNLNNIKKAVKLIAGKAKIEVSGNITLKRLLPIAKTGVDFVSSGSLTHSVNAADISLKVKNI